jgi:hypothetical protein
LQSGRAVSKIDLLPVDPIDPLAPIPVAPITSDVPPR